MIITLRNSLLASALLAVALPSPAVAQVGARVQPGPSAASEALSQNLRALVQNPRSLNALIGAGEAALELGDVNAALGFFGQADEIAPRNGRVKAGLARGVLQLENIRGALRLFDEATDLGVPEWQIAGDRGRASALRGDTRRAQRDYALSLSRRADDAVTRRYALSLGISGDRERALALLDPLLYKRDQAAWRARAFVLAMTGDKPGALAIVNRVMPPAMARAMDPFLTRLAALRPAEKAMVVHLGRFPGSGTRTATAQPGRRAAAPPAPTPTPSPSPSPRLSSGTNDPVLDSIARDLRTAPAAASDSRSARHWAQLASGGDKAALPREWRRLSAKSPDAFAGKEAWTAPAGRSHRLLAGPFDTAAEARAFVSQVGRAGIKGFAWTSAQGQDIEKLERP